MEKNLRLFSLSIGLMVSYSNVMAKTTEYQKGKKQVSRLITELPNLSDVKLSDVRLLRKLGKKKHKREGKEQYKKLNKNIDEKRKKKPVAKKSPIKKAFKKAKKKKYGFSGGFNLKSALVGGDTTLGATIKYKLIPKDYYYVKVGLKHDFSTDKEKFSYSWHIGYDDWHKGTWTVQVNHWGGIHLGEAFDSENSIGSIGYKVKSEFLERLKLSSGLTVSKKLGGNAPFKFSASLQWAPKKFWYVKGIFVKPFDGEDVTWSYVLGFDDWHPKTWGFEYSNYGSNPLDEINFKESGKFAITYKWEY